MDNAMWSYCEDGDLTLSVPLLFCEREVARYISAKMIGKDWDGDRITFPMSRVRFAVTGRLTKDTAAEFGVAVRPYVRFSVEGLQGDVFCWDGDGFLSNALAYTKWEGVLGDARKGE